MAVASNGPDTRNERSHARVKVEAFVKVGADQREFVFRTRDLSNGGLFLFTRVTHAYPFKVGANLSLELYDYDHFVRCQVTVVRIVEKGSAESDSYPTGFGVRITDIDDDNQARLEAMLNRVASDGDLY